MAVNDVIAANMTTIGSETTTTYRPAAGVHVVISFAAWQSSLSIVIDSVSREVTRNTNSHDFSPIPVNNDAYLRHGEVSGVGIITGIQIK